MQFRHRKNALCLALVLFIELALLCCVCAVCLSHTCHGENCVVCDSIGFALSGFKVAASALAPFTLVMLFVRYALFLKSG